MGANDWITIKMPYGKRHHPPKCAVGSVEQYSDGRENPVAIWGAEEIKAKKPICFPDLRSAKKAFKAKYL